MRKRLLPIILLFFAFVAQVFSQKSDFRPQLHIGLGGGALTSSMDFVPSILQKNSLGIYGGISARYISQNSLGLMLELNYAQRGWTEKFESQPDFSYTRKLHYLEVPLMTHVYFGNKTRFIFNIGPQFSFLMGNSAQMSDALASDIAAKKTQNPDAKIGVQYDSDLRKFDYGFIGGLGMELNTGIGSFEIEGRYYFGLGDLFENRKSKDNYFNRSAGRVIGAKLTYFFKVK